MTSNDMLIAVELNQRNAEVAEREQEKKIRVEYHVRREAALPIANRLQNDLGDDIGRFKSKELEVLLRWKGVPVSTMGNIAYRRILYQKFAEGVAEEVSVPTPWTEINERS